MKRIIPLVVLCFLCLSSKAQYLDGIHYRDFHNYYWEPWIDVDTSFCDVGGPKYMSGFELISILRSNYDERHIDMVRRTEEMARYVYTDRPLSILGIAVLCEIDVTHNNLDPVALYFNADTNLIFPKSEKIAIYKPTEVFDSMVELASGTYSFFNAKTYILSDSSANTPIIDSSSCDDNSPRPYSERLYVHSSDPEIYPPLRFREGYFENPVVVSDSFYVAVGLYNTIDNVPIPIADTSTELVRNHRPPHYYGSYFARVASKEYLPFDTKDPFGRHRNKFLQHNGKWASHSHFRVAYDSLAYLFDSIHTNYNEWQLYIFPIIDTIAYHYTCPVPIHFRAVEQNGDCVVLSWSSHGDHDNWQVIFVPEGASPDTASPTLCPSNLYSHCGLEPGVHYRAFVRAQCKERPDSTYFSDWVECGPIYIGMDIDLDVPTMDIERYTTLMPNPASAQVQVFSSFPLRAVEVFDLQGKPVASPAVSDRSALFDVSGWTPGLYLVSIRTSGGTTVKKLVVE